MKENKLQSLSYLKYGLAFSLVEVLIILSLIVMLCAAGLPSLHNSLQNQKSNKVISEVKKALEFARTQAQNQQQAVTLCVSKQGKCVKQLNNEISIFIDSNQNRQLDASETSFRQINFANDEAVRLRAAFGRAYLRFKSSGTVMETASLSYCPKNPDSFGGVVKVNGAGRVYELESQKEIKKALRC